jgi:hypothetical protein
MAKPKRSTKPANKKQAPKGRKNPCGNSTKGLAKKGSQSWKRAVSERSNEDSSDEELEQSHAWPQKKVRKQVKEDSGDETEAVL